MQDSSNAVLPGVTLTLSNPGTIGGTQETVTNERGEYRFTTLVPGVYGVKAELQGFRSANREGILLNADLTVKIDLVLAVGQQSETITVTGESPMLDVTTALHQEVITRQLLDAVPTGNDIWSVGRLVPGMTVQRYDVGGTEAIQQQHMNVHGSLDSDRAFTIDGLDAGSPGAGGGGVFLYFDPSMFQEMNYQVGSIAAEAAHGGIVTNMVTKTGTNQFRGAFSFAGSNDSLQSDNVTDALRREILAAVPAKALAANPNLNPGTKTLKVIDTSFTLSGPIVPDKLWFVATGRLLQNNRLLLGSYTPDGKQGIDDNSMPSGSAKISWQPTQHHQLHFLYTTTRKKRFHNSPAGLFVEPRATALQETPGSLYGTKWNWVMSPRFLLDVGGALQTGTGPIAQQPEVQPGDIPRQDLVLQTLTVSVRNAVKNPQYRGSGTISLNYFGRGHDVKVGYQYQRNMYGYEYWAMSNYPAGFVAQYRNGVPDSVLVYNTPVSDREYYVDNIAFVQDKWSLSRKLTANLGLNLQHTNGWVPANCQVATVFVSAQCFPEIPNTPNWTNVSPRFSLNYDLFGNGRTVAKLSVNHYNSQIGVLYQNRIDPVSLATETRPWTDRNGDLVPQLSELGAGSGLTLASANHYNPDVKRPYSNEYSLVLEHQIASMVFSAGYFHRDLKQNIGWKNVAVPSSTYTPITVTEVTSGMQVTVFNRAPALRTARDFVLDNYSELDGSYDGVDLTMHKRLNNHWMIMSGLTLGASKGDFYDTSTWNPYNDLNDPNYIYRRGRLLSDVPVSFKLNGLYEFPLGISLSGTYQHYTGFPENRVVLVTSATVPLTQVTQSVNVAAPGAFRLPSNDLLDISVKKTFRVGTRRFDAVADVFNLINSNTVQSRVAQFGPTFQRTVSILPPRTLRLGVNVQF